MNNSVSNYCSLDSLQDWDNFVANRYPEKSVSSQDQKGSQPHSKPDPLREFYRLNHTHQTYDFVQGQKEDFLTTHRRKMTVWEAMKLLDQLDDEANPKLISHQQHLLQTAEAIRADSHPDWFVLAGLIHDLGKVLGLFGQPQWAVGGDIFPVGCRYANEVVYPEFFRFNPDYQNATYQTPLGVYQPGEGLQDVHLSWGHGEYLYHIVKDYLPEPALYMIRYHSFCAAYRDGAYSYLLNDHDREMFRWVRLFSPYDLRANQSTPVDFKQVRPYYDKLLAKYLPEQLPF